MGRARELTVRLAAAAILIPAVTSCSSGKRIAKVNDELRTRNHELDQQVLALRRRNNELEIELQRLAQQPPQTMPSEVLANLPRIIEISIGRLSHVRDEDGDGDPESLLLYLQPLDGRGRFTQMVGTIDVNAALIPAHGDPVSAGQASFGPAEVRDAYRSTITGIHYSFAVPLQLPKEPAESDSKATVFVRVTFLDGTTGQAITAERSIPLGS